MSVYALLSEPGVFLRFCVLCAPSPFYLVYLCDVRRQFSFPIMRIPGIEHSGH